MRGLLCAALLLASACSHQSEEQKLVRSMSAPKSWAAALAFTSELWAHNSVPASLVRNSVKNAQKEMEKAQQTLDQSSADARLKERLRDDLSALDKGVRSLDNAVTQGNRRDALLSVAFFRRAHTGFDAIEKETAQ